MANGTREDNLVVFAAVLHQILNTGINGYIAITVYVFGIFGNLMSLVIFIKRRKSDRVSCQYLSVLAVADTVHMVIVSVPFWVTSDLIELQDYFTVDKQMPSTLVCQAMMSVWTSMSVTSSWVLIQFSLERTLVIWSPLKWGPVFASSKPRKIGIAVIIVSGILLSLGHYHWVELGGIEGHSDWPRCIGRGDIPVWDLDIGNTISYGIPMIIPLFVLTILNVLLIMGVRKNRISKESTTKSSNTDRRMIVNLVLVSVFFFIFITPNVVTILLTYSLERNNGFATFTMSELRIYEDVYTVGKTLFSFNSAVNPWIYTFSLDFYRQTMISMLCPCLKKKKKGKEQSQTTSVTVTDAA